MNGVFIKTQRRLRATKNNLAFLAGLQYRTHHAAPRSNWAPTRDAQTLVQPKQHCCLPHFKPSSSENLPKTCSLKRSERLGEKKKEWVNSMDKNRVAIRVEVWVLGW